ncbi:hypothetical protein ElyMa_002120500 [Elysia marginata]|uniref:Ig-like domain-containing protein n=1 Tax=Elysia marginata TaxID=1093978 RepID=A0AAV4FIN6_9GAST|nr:hypothetical protein ElyMa_002120500 [Elysia marginata]
MLRTSDIYASKSTRSPGIQQQTHWLENHWKTKQKMKSATPWHRVLEHTGYPVSKPLALRLPTTPTNCRPGEEGQASNITCTTNTDRCPDLSNNNLTWYSNLTRLVTCVQGVCSNSPHQGVSASHQLSVSTLTITNVSRNLPVAMETEWLCVGPCLNRSVACDKFQVYARPENCACRTSGITLKGEETAITVSCSTSKVYPPAQCKFYGIQTGGHHVQLNGHVSYNHTETGETPVYYRSQCSVSVPVRELRDRTHSLQAYIYPGVEGGEYLVKAIHLVTIEKTEVSDIQETDEETGTNTKKSTDHDENPSLYIVPFIAGGIAVIIVVVLILALAVLAGCNKHPKPKMEPKAKPVISGPLTLNMIDDDRDIPTNEELPENSNHPENDERDGSPSGTVASTSAPSLLYANAGAFRSPRNVSPTIPPLPAPTVTVSASTPPPNSRVHSYVLPSNLVDYAEAIFASDGNRLRDRQHNRAFVDQSTVPEPRLYYYVQGDAKPEVGTSGDVLGQRKARTKPLPNLRAGSRGRLTDLN